MSGVGLALALALVVGVLSACASADEAAVKAAPRISDSAFETSARATCAKAKIIFDTVTTLPKEPTREQSAALDETIAQTFASMVAQLRQVPVAAADRGAVNAWLADWDDYIAFGHTYAAALRAGTERDLVRNDASAQGALRRRLQGFAVANHMPGCKFQ